MEIASSHCENSTKSEVFPFTAALPFQWIVPTVNSWPPATSILRTPPPPPPKKNHVVLTGTLQRVTSLFTASASFLCNLFLDGGDLLSHHTEFPITRDHDIILTFFKLKNLSSAKDIFKEFPFDNREKRAFY